MLVHPTAAPSLYTIVQYKLGHTTSLDYELLNGQIKFCMMQISQM